MIAVTIILTRRYHPMIYDYLKYIDELKVGLGVLCLREFIF